MNADDLINEINNAIGAHGSWKIKLRTAVNKGESDQTPEDVRCDDKCVFGKWLNGSTIDTATRSGAPYQVIKRLHAEFHVCASEVLRKAITGDKNGAIEMLEGDFAARSEKLVRGLRKWKGEASA